MKFIGKPLFLTLIFGAVMCGLILDTVVNTKELRRYKTVDTQTDAEVHEVSSSNLDEFLKNKPKPPSRLYFDDSHPRYIDPSPFAEMLDEIYKIQAPKAPSLKTSVELKMPWEIYQGKHLYTPPALMPIGAAKSGKCEFMVRVSEVGKVLRVFDLECSDPIFIGPTQKSVMKRTYNPKFFNDNGLDFETSDKLYYNLVDERGIRISE